MADIEELQRILKIVSEPELMPTGTRWYQGDWAIPVYDTNDGAMCGTALCFAGWKAHLDGYTEYHRGTDGGGGLLNPQTGTMLDYLEIGDYARDTLGLTEADADALFSGDNTLKDLERCVARIADGLPAEYEDDIDWDEEI